MFSEGGNFSPKETELYQKRLEKIAKRIDSTEEGVHLDMEQTEYKCLEQVMEFFLLRFKDIGTECTWYIVIELCGSLWITVQTYSCKQGGAKQSNRALSPWQLSLCQGQGCNHSQQVSDQLTEDGNRIWPHFVRLCLEFICPEFDEDSTMFVVAETVFD